MKYSLITAACPLLRQFWSSGKAARTCMCSSVTVLHSLPSDARVVAHHAALRTRPTTTAMCDRLPTGIEIQLCTIGPENVSTGHVLSCITCDHQCNQC